ncbi:hypothetical protein ACJX0J_016473, partial [Zea mays]
LAFFNISIQMVSIDLEYGMTFQILNIFHMLTTSFSGNHIKSIQMDNAGDIIHSQNGLCVEKNQVFFHLCIWGYMLVRVQVPQKVTKHPHASLKDLLRVDRDARDLKEKKHTQICTAVERAL